MSVNPQGLVLHIMEGSIESCYAWFQNPESEVSAHFGNAKDGRLWQFVDTVDKAWAEAAGNPNWFSIENEGSVPTQLTPKQLENVAQLFAWMHKTYGIPLQITNDVNGKGLGWHGMGGVAWGNHPSCPGTQIENQRTIIVARAIQISQPVVKKVTYTVAQMIKSPVTVAAKITGKPVIADHPGGGMGLVYLGLNLWQGIPDGTQLTRLRGQNIKDSSSVPASFWSKAKQVAW